MISLLSGLLGSILSLVGWFGFHSLPLLIIGTVIYVIDVAFQIRNMNAGAIVIEFVIFFIGSIIGVFIHIPFYITGMIALAIYGLIITLITIPMVIAKAKEK